MEYYVMRSDELCHFGIHGMKWGIRRYQNMDGSYTQEGLRRYRKAQGDYERAKSSNDKAAVSSAKQNLKAEKKSLKRDIRADRGKELHQKGVTTGKTLLKAAGAFGISQGAAMVSLALTKNGNYSAAMAAGVVAGGARTVAIVLAGKAALEYPKLREYKKRQRS